MQAIVYTEYGSPDVLQCQELEQPIPNSNEVLVRVEAAAVSATDAIFRAGRPLIARLGSGLFSPKLPVLGDVFAGEIVAVGDAVTQYKEGDCVFGTTGPGFGAHAEYIVLPEDGIFTSRPASLSPEEAAALCDGGLTALPFLREEGKIHAGQQVLINGASGAIGTVAVQLARHFGATVTGVCSTANLALVQSLGAGAVIDYTKDDFTRAEERYDIIFDTVGKSSFSRCKGVLKPGGIYLSTVLAPGIVFQMLKTAKFGDRKAVIAFAGLRPPAERARDLDFLKGLVEAGALRAVIDAVYPLADIADAHRHVDSGHKKGNVVIRMGQEA